MRRPQYIAAVILAVLLVHGRHDLAAQTRAQITGRVTDATGAALPGATVTLSGNGLVGGPRTAVTSADGSYEFWDIGPGTYEISAGLAGFQTVARRDLRILTSTVTAVDLRLETVRQAETVTVTGDAALLDVKRSSSDTHLTNEILQNVPLRIQSVNPTALVNYAPGISNTVAYGGPAFSVAYIIDGVRTGNPGDEGNLTAQLNNNWLEEVQVVGLGAAAEYGEYSGAASNMIVRSGGNSYSGLFEYSGRGRGWESDNVGDLPPVLGARFRPRETRADWDSSLQLGGPIVKDRLTFFSGFQYYRREMIGAGSQGAVSNTVEGPRFIAKVAWAPRTRLRIEGFAGVGEYNEDGFGASPQRLPETVGRREVATHHWSGRATITPSDRTLIELRYGGLNYRNSIVPVAPQGEDGPAPRQDLVTGLFSGNITGIYHADAWRHQVNANVTRYAQRAGSHVFKAGVEVEQTTNREINRYPGDRFFQDQSGQPFQVTLWAGDTTEPKGLRTTIYGQDQWRLTDRVTLNPGLRVTFNRGSVDGRGTVYSTNSLSPRLGVTWDVDGRHRTVVRAHYGRFDAALLSSAYFFLDRANLSPRITARVVGPDQFVEINRFSPATNSDIDPDITHPFSHQVVVGVERGLWNAGSIELRYIHQRYDGLYAFIDTGSVYEPVSRQDPGVDGRPGTADDGGAITVYNLTNPGNKFALLTNPDEAYRRYDAVQFVGRTRSSSPYQATASYTWSRARGTLDNFIGVSLGRGDGGDAGVFADPNRAINREGRSTFDFTHEVKVTGTVVVPGWGDTRISGFYQFYSGRAWGRTASIAGLSQGSVSVRLEPRGTRRVDAINQIDVRIEKTFPAFGFGRLGVYVDCANLTNQGVAVGVVDSSGSSFGTPTIWTGPRTVRAGARFSF
jgi:outer membrane receptor protein involved in Fe transport